MIDLHVHSTASDGTCTPEELAERGLSFTLMALTDHDNTGGCARFLAACRQLGVSGLRLPGIELSVDPSDVGKVIGKQGRIAKAIRTIVKAASVDAEKKYVVDIL